jgi:N-acetyl-anhydromuramoyl-L-alanine amidase
VTVNDGIGGQHDGGGIWWPGARRLISPNQDARPGGCTPSLVVIHAISLPPGEFGGPWIDDLFTNRLDPAAHPYFREIASLRVSSHLLVRRDGSLVQYVPLDRRAGHAGRSRFQGRPACNDYSVGIELEGCDDQAFTGRQYAVLAELVAGLIRLWPEITPERVTGHQQVAPGRKTDPGPMFHWHRFRSMLRERLATGDL